MSKGRSSLVLQLKQKMLELIFPASLQLIPMGVLLFCQCLLDVTLYPLQKRDLQS